MDPESEKDTKSEEEPREPLDQIATILFLVFGCALGYLIIAYSYGLYPFVVIDLIQSLLPTWEAVITFVAILIIMFVSLIGGLLRMRYSIYLVATVALIAIFVILFYALLAISQLIVPLPP
ncbi:MAG: hypothetical protein ACFE9D_11155 [Promethearchaeota archaeon]